MGGGQCNAAIQPLAMKLCELPNPAEEPRSSILTSADEAKPLYLRGLRTLPRFQHYPLLGFKHSLTSSLDNQRTSTRHRTLQVDIAGGWSR